LLVVGIVAAAIPQGPLVGSDVLPEALLFALRVFLQLQEIPAEYMVEAMVGVAEALSDELFVEHFSIG
jgi:hypothetical protein